MSCNDLKWSYSDAQQKFTTRSNELAQVEARQSELTWRHSALTSDLQEKEARVDRIETQLWNADGPARATLLMELGVAKADRDRVLTERAGIDGSLRAVRSEISRLQQGIASAQQAKARLQSEWQSAGCEGRIDW
ncbi:hypothetical protein [Salinarimonas chemoclinalis]|uniref:hypothetical protein n=1 Tax=Salinarimonas chemoclinalis TaxID=3241599 RepID=UPI003555E8C3